MGEREGPSLTLVLLAVFAVALAARVVPLYWSPLPATLDGFRYAALAERTLSTGTLPLGFVKSDEVVFSLVLAAASTLTGVPPLQLAQPLVAVVGAGVPVVGAALAHRLGLERGWNIKRSITAAALTGVALALDGIVLRRTGVPDEEAIGLLLVPLLTIAAHQWLTDGRTAWGVSTLLLLVTLPPTHNLSSLLGVLAVWTLASVHAVRADELPGFARCLTLGAVAWGVFFVYFESASRLGLALTYSGLLRPYLGLFVAWVVLIPLAAVWVGRTSDRIQRLVVGGPPMLCLALIGLNSFTPLFPGTVLSPPLVAGLLMSFTVPILFAAVGAPVLGRGSGLVSLAGYAAPLGLTYYAFSASLTPRFFDLVLRAQTFGHLPILALSSIGVVTAVAHVRARGIPRRRAVSVCLVGLFVAGILLTLPLGYLNLDTASYPSTTFESEFQATAFAAEHTQGEFATDHSLSRVVGHYHSRLNRPTLTGPTGRSTVGPTRAWLAGGVPPDCAVVSQRSWTTTGAHLYPAPPDTISDRSYRAFLERRNLVYDAGGHDPIVVSVPPNGTTDTC